MRTFPRRLLRPSSWGVRVRSTLAAVLAVAVAFGLASVVLLVILERSLEASVDGTLIDRVGQVSGQLRSTAAADVDPKLLAVSGQANLVQLVVDGRVVAASTGAPSDPLLAPDRTTDGTAVVTFHLEDSEPEYRVAARTVTVAGGQVTVEIGAEQEPITRTLAVVAGLLVAGLPVVVLFAAVVTSLLVGRSLRPVEEMRATVGEITAADLTDRLPVPPTGDEVARLARTLNAMLARLEAGQAAQQRFVGDASHELRSPLATLTTALELGAQRPELLDQALVTGQLLPEAIRMQHLVDDLLLLARADERGLPLRLVDVDLDDVLGAEAARLRDRPGLRVHTRAVPTRVQGDLGQLTRAVRNLVDNAVRHAGAGVTLACHRDGVDALVVVGDDGPGIAAADRERVLQRFVRLDADRARAAGGSGLGLAIVAEITAAHGGTVTVGSSPEGGAQLTLRLPVEHRPSQRPDPPPASSPSATKR